jgi:MFS family permease
VFFVGAIPALITLWIRRSVEEPAIWREGRHRAVSAPDSIRQIFSPAFRRHTIAMMLLNAGALFTYWGFNFWNPAYLSLAPAQGGLGFSARIMSTFVMVMQASTWVGYLVFGATSDRFGRKRIFITYLVLAACFLAFYPAARSPVAIMVLGSGVGFFGTGFFAGFGPVVSELFPTPIRGMALAVTYNSGRIVSATAPFVVGSLASAARGFSLGFTLCAVALLFSASMWFFVPETRGRELT